MVESDVPSSHYIIRNRSCRDFEEFDKILRKNDAVPVFRNWKSVIAELDRFIEKLSKEYRLILNIKHKGNATCVALATKGSIKRIFKESSIDESLVMIVLANKSDKKLFDDDYRVIGKHTIAINTVDLIKTNATYWQFDNAEAKLVSDIISINKK